MLYFFALSLRSILLLITLRSYSYSFRFAPLPPRVRFAILFSRLTPQSTRLAPQTFKKTQEPPCGGGGYLFSVVGCSFVLLLFVNSLLFLIVSLCCECCCFLLGSPILCCSLWAPVVLSVGPPFCCFYCVFRDGLPNLSAVPEHFVVLFYSCDILYMNLFLDD
jgi:hypothetical protein